LVTVNKVKFSTHILGNVADVVILFLLPPGCHCTPKEAELYSLSIDVDKEMKLN